MTLVERATGLLLVGKSPDKTVKSVNKVLIRLLDESPLPVRTLTLDNGTEFHGYRAVEAATGVQIYFARRTTHGREAATRTRTDYSGSTGRNGLLWRS